MVTLTHDEARSALLTVVAAYHDNPSDYLYAVDDKLSDRALDAGKSPLGQFQCEILLNEIGRILGREGVSAVSHFVPEAILWDLREPCI